MKVTLKIQDNTTGQIYDISNATSDVKVTWKRKNEAGKLTATFHNIDKIYFPKGSIVMMYVDGFPFFKGYLFTNEFDKWYKTRIEAYDQLRYLKTNDSFMFKGQTATQIIQTIATNFGLTLGTIENTNYVISYMIEENKSLFDIISKALRLTLVGTGIIYNFYDNFGSLCLTQANKMYSQNKLAYGTTLTDFKYKGTIDSDTYNYIKYVFDSTATGKQQIQPGQDANNIRKWGKLQYFDVIDSNLNQSQITEMVNATLKYYNRELKTITFESVGDVSLRAGSMVYVDLGVIDNNSMVGYQLIDKIEHTFTNGVHKMHVETRELTELSGWSSSWRK